MKAIVFFKLTGQTLTLEQPDARDLAADLYEAFPDYTERGARSYDPLRIAAALSRPNRRPRVKIQIVR